MVKTKSRSRPKKGRTSHPLKFLSSFVLQLAFLPFWHSVNLSHQQSATKALTTRATAWPTLQERTTVGLIFRAMIRIQQFKVQRQYPWVRQHPCKGLFSSTKNDWQNVFPNLEEREKPKFSLVGKITKTCHFLPLIPKITNKKTYPQKTPKPTCPHVLFQESQLPFSNLITQSPNYPLHLSPLPNKSFVKKVWLCYANFFHQNRYLIAELQTLWLIIILATYSPSALQPNPYPNSQWEKYPCRSS